MKRFVETEFGRVFEVGDGWTPLRELVDGKWVEPRSICFGSIMEAERISEQEVLKRLNSSSSNNWFPNSNDFCSSFVLSKDWIYLGTLLHLS